MNDFAQQSVVSTHRANLLSIVERNCSLTLFCRYKASACKASRRPDHRRSVLRGLLTPRKAPKLFIRRLPFSVFCRHANCLTIPGLKTSKRT